MLVVNDVGFGAKLPAGIAVKSPKRSKLIMTTSFLILELLLRI